jgi:hypothetical protein
MKVKLTDLKNLAKKAILKYMGTPKKKRGVFWKYFCTLNFVVIIKAL